MAPSSWPPFRFPVLQLRQHFGALYACDRIVSVCAAITHSEHHSCTPTSCLVGGVRCVTASASRIPRSTFGGCTGTQQGIRPACASRDVAVTQSDRRVGSNGVQGSSRENSLHKLGCYCNPTSRKQPKTTIETYCTHEQEARLAPHHFPLLFHTGSTSGSGGQRWSTCRACAQEQIKFKRTLIRSRLVGDLVTLERTHPTSVVTATFTAPPLVAHTSHKL